MSTFRSGRGDLEVAGSGHGPARNPDGRASDRQAREAPRRNAKERLCSSIGPDVSVARTFETEPDAPVVGPLCRYPRRMTTSLVVLEFVKALAWPLSVVAALVVFRSDLRTLVARTTRVDAMGASAQFEKAVALAGVNSVAAPGNASLPRPKATITVTSFTDAQAIGMAFKVGPATVDVSALEDDLAKRIVDFMAGLVYMAEGTIERISSRVFILWPR